VYAGPAGWDGGAGGAAGFKKGKPGISGGVLARGLAGDLGRRSRRGVTHTRRVREEGEGADRWGPGAARRGERDAGRWDRGERQRRARAVGRCCRWLVGRCACGLSGERESVARGPRGASRWEARPLAGGVGEVRCGARAAAGLSERVRGWLGRSEVRERAERVWAGGLGFSQWAGLGF